MRGFTEATKYTVYGALFGLCFPVGSIAFLYFIGDLPGVNSLAEAVRAAHANSLLYVIDSAPFFLGLFARLAGVRQDRLQRFSDSLEQQVTEKTQSLSSALQRAKQANETIVHMADHDALTGLLNRRRFQKTLEDWISYALRYHRTGTLMFIDLDHFKGVNDTHGHNVGDEYLKAVAQLLTTTLRSTDIVARWGGDEFATFLPETSGIEAHQVANKLLAAFARASFSLGEHSVQPSASIGLAFVPDQSLCCNELIASADAAMYEAKKAGRGCWRVYAASEIEVQHVQDHLQWEARIRRALENDQFLLLYQPLFNLKTQHTEGYEALLRMEDRQGHLIMPGKFLASAERCSLSSPIDFMVIRKAARRIAALGAQEPEVWISVNLSAQALQDKNLLSQIEIVLQENPIVAKRLRFELSETIVLQNFALVREVSMRIQKLGCRVVLDDFGISDVPSDFFSDIALDMVKLHPSLSSESQRARLKSLTSRLHGLHLKVAVKSVEDETLLDMLRDVGVDYAQGFALGRPLESIEQRALALTGGE